MDERKQQFRVGITIVATLLAFGILIAMFNGPSSIIGDKITLTIKTDEAPGVSQGTPVLKSGILIGRVSSVRLNPAGDVVIEARVDRDKPLTTHDLCEISGSILGDSEIRFVRALDPKGEEKKIEDGAVLTARRTTSPIELIDRMQGELSEAIGAVKGTATGLQDVLGEINHLLKDNKETFNRIIDNSELTMQSFRAAADNTNRIIGDPELQENLRRSIRELPVVLSDTRRSLEQINQSFKSVSEVATDVRQLTEPLGNRGPELVRQFETAVNNLEAISTEMRQFSQAINRTDGTVGKLLNDSELYDNLNATAATVRDLTVQLRPIVNDVRIFTDKISRHPGEIVRDAVRPGAGTKYGTRLDYDSGTGACPLPAQPYSSGTPSLPGAGIFGKRPADGTAPGYR